MPLRLRERAEKQNEEITLPVEHLSFSSISTYLSCSMQWYFRYIEQIKSPPSVFLEFGSSGHEALKYNNVNKFDTGNDVPTKIVVDKFSDEFQTRSNKIEDWDGEPMSKSYDKHQRLGQKFLTDYMKEAAPYLKPDKMPEQKVEQKIAGVNFVGYIDLIANKTIHDYKFVGIAKGEKDVKNSLQMWIYSIVEKLDDVAMVSFCKKNGNIKGAYETIDDNDRNWAKTLIRKTAGAISAGIFIPRSPEGMEKWKCTPRFCGYYHRCRGGSKRMI